MFKKVVIAGVGLIGGSLGLALTRKKLAREVVGVDPDLENLKLAVCMGAVGRAGTLSEELPTADLLILATPIGVTLGVLEMARPYLAPGTIVTDVGSVKGRLVERAEAMLPSRVYFVGGHPMAGRELAGVAGAREDLFTGAAYVLTPTASTNPAALHVLRQLVQALGAIPLELSCRQHDRAVALISHLPHLLAATLVNTAAGEADCELLLKLAAGGFRDTTRIAAGNPAMWRDILLTNRDMVLQAVKNFRQQLTTVEQAIRAFEREELVQKLAAAREIRQNLPENRKHVLAELHENEG
ncbi:prephenate dehydrogenase [Desulforamulus hydrothermalis]|uniref:Prephenate dehydrogenase n=1 Tax=Desulforamulus hydrothermalis Lam5 = DSM 18033 TaxID=1121428 RepID=K8E0K8_9FIRM|nr:prephenate dehydrogenase [Desulforamulus hydrothermalis]CCO09015.1 Prephenate dehydrogenase [Desulforamulus hydrothermalis Lam5 = DSM 18033]SHG76981.1 prephenate dehydrogenase [Desulforamulus hydrothermalis Lam5 = DSM 18033]